MLWNNQMGIFHVMCKEIQVDVTNIGVDIF